MSGKSGKLVDCQEARNSLLALAEDTAGIDTRPLQAEVAAHIESCPDCQIRLERLARDLLFDPAIISCAECKRQLYRYVEIELAGRSAPLKFPDISRHLQACPDCTSLYRALRDELGALITELSAQASQSEAPGARPTPRQEVTVIEITGRHLWWMAVAAGMVIALGLGVFLGRQQEESVAWRPPQSTQVAIAPPPAPVATAVSRPAAVPSLEAPTRAMATSAPRPQPATVMAASSNVVTAALPAAEVTLVSPVNGATVSDHVVFSWDTSSPLAPDEQFSLTVCKGERCTPDMVVTQTTATIWEWCPDEDNSIYRWQVRIIGAGAEGRGHVSPAFGFIWHGSEAGKLRAQRG